MLNLYFIYIKIYIKGGKREREGRKKNRAA